MKWLLLLSLLALTVAVYTIIEQESEAAAMKKYVEKFGGQYVKEHNACVQLFADHILEL